MIIDSLINIYSKPLVYRFTLQSTLLSVELSESYNISRSISLKEINQLNFNVPYYLENNELNINYDLIKTGFKILCELYSPETETVFSEECYLITNTREIDSDGKISKQVSCKSLEYQLNSKILKSYQGSKVLYRTQSEINSWVTSELYPTKQSFIESGILNVITQLNPSWSINESGIDEDIRTLYRYIDVDGSDCLSFLLNDVQQSFLCVLNFDTINKRIGARNLTHLGTNRGFLLYNDYVKSHTKETDDESITTRLYITGHEGINIRSVNISGEDYILDLSYYRNTKYMSQSLLDALDSYDDLMESKEGIFSTLLSSLNSYMSQLSIKKSDLVILEAELVDLDVERDRLIRQGETNLSSINAQITSKKNEISTKNSEITVINGNIQTVTNSIEELQEEILISNNFTLEQISELDQYIRDKEVTDDTITTPQELYEEGIKILSQVNQPLIKFDIDIVDIFNLVEAQIDWNKITIGDIVTIRHDEFNTDVKLRLLSYRHDWDSNKLVLTFANQYNLNNPNMFAEQLKSTISRTSSLDIQKYKFLDYVNSGDKTAIYNYITGILDLGAQKAVAGANEDVQFGKNGLTLVNPAYPNRQLRLMSSGVYKTEDGWQTAKWCMDESGINAEVVRGLLGEFVVLKANQIQINDDGSGLNEIGVKVSHDLSGSYTSLEYDGLLRYVAYPTYTYTTPSPPNPNQENFTTNNSIVKLITAGWEFNGTDNNVTSNQLVIGRISSNRITSDYDVWARTTQYITKSDTTFSFTYYTGDDDYTSHYFSIDDNVYNLSVTTTPTTWSLSSHSSNPLTEGLHTFQWFSRNSLGYTTKPYNIIMYIDNIVFESNQLSKTLSGTATTGSNYNYLTAAGSSSTGSLQSHGSSSVPTVWVQLPDTFKNKDFNVTVFLQDTGNSNGYAISDIGVNVLEIDNVNAKFLVQAYLGRVTYGWNGSTVVPIYYSTGCDFAYVCTV